MELLTILVADYANITQNGKLNVMGIFGNIFATNFPAKHLSMTLVVKLGANYGEYDDQRNLAINLRDPDGNEVWRFESPVKIPPPAEGRRPEVNAIIQINELVFPHPGRYQFNVYVDKDFKGDLPVEVIQTVQKASEKKKE